MDPKIDRMLQKMLEKLLENPPYGMTLTTHHYTSPLTTQPIHNFVTNVNDSFQIEEKKLQATHSPFQFENIISMNFITDRRSVLGDKL